VLEVTACVDEPDELTSLEVYNTVWPHDAVTIDAVHSFRDSAQDYVDYLVREDGVILGCGVGAIFAYRARRVVTLITVLTEQRRRGTGTALYEAISRWASERGACELEVSVAGNDPESLDFAQRRGFTEERRQVGLVLSLTGLAPPQIQPPAGIEIVTWAQRPELARGMYEVDLETHPDIPGFEDVAAEPFEDWMAHNMQRPTDSPEATFIALANEEVVGFAKLSLTAPTAAGHALTAVKRAWRGRGIARALKATEINWALANGYTELHTSNEERNTSIKRLNARLGYRPGIARIYLVGPIAGA
jgi:GNAT superfamily N-acetyltransferase